MANLPANNSVDFPAKAEPTIAPYTPQQPDKFVDMEKGTQGSFLKRGCGFTWSRRNILIIVSVVAILVLVLGLGLGLGLKHHSGDSSPSTVSTTPSSSTTTTSTNCCTTKCGTIGFSTSGQKCCGNAVSGQAGLHSYCSPALELAGCNTSC